MLMEYCSGNGLIDFMNTRLREQLTEPEILQIACDIGLGVASMHYLSPPLIHRDLKIENVLISADRVYKLCDFGSVSNILQPPRNSTEFQILDNDIQSHTTAQYRAPEMVDIGRGFPIDEKSDIWAFGVFIYKLCYYTTPFEREGNMAILNARFSFPPTPAYSDRLKRIINVTLSEDPRLRPNIFQCIKELYSMRGLEPPIADVYSAPTSTSRKEPVSTPSPSTLEPEAAAIALKPTPEPPISTNNPYRTQSTTPSNAGKTPEQPPVADEDVESKYPTIEELSQTLESQSISTPSPYANSGLYTSSVSNFPQAMPVPTSAIPISMAPNSYASSSLMPSTSPWGSYKQPSSGSFTSTVPSLPRHGLTTTSPLETIPNVTSASYSTTSSIVVSSPSSSEDDLDAVVDGTRPVRTINLNRSASTASMKRPPSSLSRPRPEDSKYPITQGNVDDRIQRPRPVSLYVKPSDTLLDLNTDVPPVPKTTYPMRPPTTEPTLIEPVVSDERDNLKALLTGLSEKSKTVLLNNGELSNADYLKALADDNPVRSGRSRSPQKLFVSGSSGDSSEEETYIKSRSTSRNEKRTSMLKSKINDAFKMFENPGSRSTSSSEQQPRLPPRPPSEYPSSGYVQNKRMSYSTENLNGFGMDRGSSEAKPDGSKTPNPEFIVRQASFMEAEDPAQFERPSKHDKYSLSGVKSSMSLGRHHTVSHRSTSSSTTAPMNSTNPAYSIQNRIHALINGQASPPPRTASGYGKYTDDLVGQTYEEQPPRASVEYNMQGYTRKSDLESEAPILMPKPKPKPMHNRQLSIISSDSSATESGTDPDSGISADAAVNGGITGRKQAPKLPSKPVHLQSPQRQNSDLESQRQFFQQTNGAGLPPTPSAASGAVTPKPKPGAATNLMDERSPVLGNEDWKEVFNKKYPSLA